MNSNNSKPQNPNPNRNRALQPGNSGQINNRPPQHGQPQNKTARDAHALRPRRFQDEQTAVFNQVPTGPMVPMTPMAPRVPKVSNASNASNASKERRQAPDGTYNYTGRNIKSSRQKFAYAPDIHEDIHVERDRKRSRERDREDVTETRGGGILAGILKAILYIVGVFAVSVALAYNIVMITNDVFAFVHLPLSEEPVSVEITLPQNADIDSISRLLADNGLIRYPFIFRIYAGLRSRDRVWEFRGGETFNISSDMGYDEFIRAFRTGPAPRQEIRLSFPEGWSVDQIIDRLVANGIGTRSRFEYVINNHRFPHEFLQPLYESELSPYRRYVLEGYLFPDTYYFFTDDNEIAVITRFLDNFERRFDVRSNERLRILGMTLDELITLASIIEREARHPEDFSKVSAVFHNRLLNPGLLPFLESDATILYDFDEHRDVTRADLDIDSPFNTYTRPGLPPSAIANPGRNAILAALEPYEDFLGLYFFFVSSRIDGTKLYARTNAQHVANINTMNRRAEEAGRVQ